MLHVIEYFVRSLKVIENGIIQNLGYDFLFAFHINCSRIFSRFDAIRERENVRNTSQPDTARRHRPPFYE